MIELSFPSFLLFAACVALSSVAGLLLAAAMPWSEDARRVRLASAVGLALGPFLFGFGAVLALGLFRGASHGAHLGVLLAFLAALAIAGFFLRRKAAHALPSARPAPKPLGAGEWAIAIAIAFAVVALLFISVFVPLTQNDALEYAIVARELYATRDLLSYPVLNPETNLSGFYGPWTHPPLYVALLYMAEVIQGHADAPGAIRLISPWFLLTGAYVVYALGALVNRVTGLAACLIFMSPPLFFLGAGQALLDPLPVLGFTLILAAVVGLHARALLFGALVGGFLGLALWTHSQAILFIPLALAALGIERGLKDFRGLILAAGALLLVALIIGGWPYWRNIEVFGTPISDNPAVFAMPELHWDDYFSINRGLNNTTAMIQYGILKGWFAIESYGFIFWGMTVGMVFFLAGQRLTAVRKLIIEGARGFERREAALWLMGALLIVYIVGVILSVVLGIEHMVKNERYLLVTLPMVAVLCAYGYVRLVGWLSRKRDLSRVLISVGHAAIAVALLAQIAFFTFYIALSTGMKGENAFKSLEEKLFRTAQFSILELLRRHASEEDIVFSMRPADLYYVPNRMVSYLDPMTLDLYRIEEPKRVIDWLSDNGIRYLHIPDYGLPPQYNTAIYKVLRNPELTSLLGGSPEGQIYEVKQDDVRLAGRENLFENAENWVQEKFLVLGGRKGFGNIKVDSRPMEGALSTDGLLYGFFHRNTATSVTIFQKDFRKTQVGRLENGDEFALDLTLRGRGLVRLFVDATFLDPDEDEEKAHSRRLVTFELSDEQPQRTYSIRFGSLEGALDMSISVDHVGVSNVEIIEADLNTYRRRGS